MRTPKNRLQDLAQNLQRRQAQKQSSKQEQSPKGGKPSVEAKSFDHNQPINLHTSGQGQPRQTDQSASVQAMAFDHNEPIELRYNQETNSYAPKASAYAAAHSVEPDLDFGSEAFEVESFDAEPVAVAQSISQPEVVEERSQPMPSRPEVVADQSQPVPTKSAASPIQSHTAIEPKPSALQEVATAEDFLEDLQAILNGEKTYDGNGLRSVSNQPQQVTEHTPQANQLSIPEPATPTPEPPPPSPVEPAQQTSPHDVFDRMAQGIPPEPTPSESTPTYSNAHSIFDRMGKNMAFANSFDLGTISLQQRFDEFDRVLDADDRKSQKTQVDLSPSQAELSPLLSNPLSLEESYKTEPALLTIVRNYQSRGLSHAKAWLYAGILYGYAGNTKIPHQIVKDISQSDEIKQDLKIIQGFRQWKEALEYGYKRSSGEYDIDEKLENITKIINEALINLPDYEAPNYVQSPHESKKNTPQRCVESLDLSKFEPGMIWVSPSIMSFSKSEPNPESGYAKRPYRLHITGLGALKDLGDLNQEQEEVLVPAGVRFDVTHRYESKKKKTYGDRPVTHIFLKPIVGSNFSIEKSQSMATLSESLETSVKTKIHFIWWGNPQTDDQKSSATAMPNLMSSMIPAQGQHTVMYWRQYGDFNGELNPAIELQEIRSSAEILLDTSMWYGRGILIDSIVNSLTQYHAYSAVKDLLSLLVLYKHGGYYFDTTITVNPLVRDAQILRNLLDYSEPRIVLNASRGNFTFAPDDRSGDATFSAQIISPTMPGVIQTPSVDVWAMYAPKENECVGIMIDAYLERAQNLGLNKYPSSKRIHILDQEVHEIMTRENKTMRNELIGKLIICSVQEGLVKYTKRQGKPVEDYAWETILLSPPVYGASAYCPSLDIYKRHAGFWRH